MRKLALSFAVLLTVSFVGCSSQDGGISEIQSQFSREENFIRIGSKNLYEMNFAGLKEQLEEIIDAKDNRISMPFMYDLPAVDIFFMPSGEIISFDMALRTLTGENDNEFIISQYKIKNDTDMTGFDIQLSEKDKPFLKSSFEDIFAFDKFPAFIEWADGFDFEKVIQEYSVGEPAHYEFLAGVNIQREIIDNENVNCIFLDCSSETPVQVQYEDLPYSNPDILPFEPTYNEHDRSQYLDYYIILPYYSINADVTEYNGYNRIIILFPNGV
ncbi:MAG: hypothetical protein J1F28_01085 [Oscillospiraceae bacterium]|nr:hypothetical protein [Oscillospiraceae bacterium]